jgi:hypothetical protein
MKKLKLVRASATSVILLAILSILIGVSLSSFAQAEEPPEVCEPEGDNLDGEYMFCVLRQIREFAVGENGVGPGTLGEDLVVALALQSFQDLGIDAWVEDFPATQLNGPPATFTLVQGENPPGGWLTPVSINQTDPTPPGGLTAEVVYVGRGTREEFAAHAPSIPGKIVLVDSDLVYNTIFSALSATRSLDLAKKYGAVGVIVSQRSDVGDLPRGVQATPLGGGSYVPGVFVPSLTVSNWEGNLLRDQILRGDTVVASFTGSFESSEVTSHNVVAHLPGNVDESVIVYGYFAGTSGSPLRNNTSVPAVLELARHYKQIWEGDGQGGNEPGSRKHMYFVLFGDHGGTGGGEAFIEAHQDDILPTASVFGINRVGITKFRDPLRTGYPLNMGEPETRAVFATNPAIVDSVAKSYKRHRLPNAIFLPGSVMMIGEGQDFMAACAPTVLTRQINIGLGTPAADPLSTVLPGLVNPEWMARDVTAYRDVIDDIRRTPQAELLASDASPGCNPEDPSGFVDPVGDGHQPRKAPEIPGGVVVLNNPGKVSAPAQGKIFPVFAYVNDLRSDREAMVIRIDWDFGDGTPIVNRPLATHLYFEPGNYTITATLTDYLGNQTSESTVVTIEP